MEQKYIEKLEAFVSGNLSEEEARDFRDQIDQDPELKQLVNETELAMQVIDRKVERDLKARFSQWRTSASDTREESEARPLFPPYMIGIAAAILLLITSVWIWQTNYSSLSGPEIAANYYEVPVASGSSRGNDDPAQAGLSAFRAKNYQEAVRLLAMNRGSNPESDYFLAQSYYLVQDYNQAQNVFQELSQGTSAYKTSSEWYLALTQLNLDNRQGFNQALSTILENPAHPFRNKALKLKKQTERRWN